MFTIEQYIRAESLEQAYTLNQKRTATVLGGCGWLRMGSRRIGTAIDLSGLGLDKIEETADGFRIGCMVTLRQLETSDALRQAFGSCFVDALQPIVGVQFRNCATIGGSIWARFGFSDPLTLLLALDASVELYQGGVISLRDFSQKNYDNDLLISIFLPKCRQKICYLTHRAQATDLPVLTCAAAFLPAAGWRLVIGARPQRAVLVEDTEGMLQSGVTAETAAAFAEFVEKQLNFSSNMRGSAEFRRHLARILGRRALLHCAQEVTQHG